MGGGGWVFLCAGDGETHSSTNQGSGGPQDFGGKGAYIRKMHAWLRIGGYAADSQQKGTKK